MNADVHTKHIIPLTLMMVSKGMLYLLSPEEIYSRKLSKQELFAAVSHLPEKQAKRIYAHFFLGISKAQIPDRGRNKS